MKIVRTSRASDRRMLRAWLMLCASLLCWPDVLDIAHPAALMPAHESSGAARGTFALSCLGERWIRPLITADGVHILLLNRSLTYPGAWSVGGIVAGLTRGEDGRGIHRLAADHFARGKGKPEGSMRSIFSHGE